MRLRSLVNISDEDVFDDFTEELTQFAKELNVKYGEDIRRLALFHALIGSTIGPYTGIEGDDLEGTDSIAKFIDDMYGKYKQYLPKE